MNVSELIDYWRDHRHNVSMAIETESMLQQLQYENDLLRAQVKRLKEIIEKSIDMNNVLAKL